MHDTIPSQARLLSLVQWRDLVHLSKIEIVRELTLSLPWLAASWLAASHGLWLIALPCSFMFFLTGLRQVHNAHHYAIGLSRAATEWVMFALSVLMLGSMHAVQVNHLRHHRFCMQDEDVEALSARMAWWKALLFGPLFPILLHYHALRLGKPRQRRWIILELAANVLWITVVLGALRLRWLEYHVLVMALGQCMTAFFAVWTVHHDCHPSEIFARTVRSRFKAALTYNMFFHLEHHLFPAVPTCKLRTLAGRLDEVAPQMAEKKVF